MHPIIGGILRRLVAFKNCGRCESNTRDGTGKLTEPIRFFSTHLRLCFMQPYAEFEARQPHTRRPISIGGQPVRLIQNDG